jgi:hypothetical protein
MLFRRNSTSLEYIALIARSQLLATPVDFNEAKLYADHRDVNFTPIVKTVLPLSGVQHHGFASFVRSRHFHVLRSANQSENKANTCQNTQNETQEEITIEKENKEEISAANHTFVQVVERSVPE